jgi:hypothetical protein
VAGPCEHGNTPFDSTCEEILTSELTVSFSVNSLPDGVKVN